jgi:DNA-binding MarR family transcriptional regulator
MSSDRRPFELIWHLAQISRAITQELNTRLADEGFADLPASAGLAFSRLAGGGASSGELAAFLGISKQAAGQLVDQLEKKGLVRRTPGPDGRTKTVKMTERGYQCTRAATRISTEIEARWAARVGAERLDSLVADLRAIREDEV